MRRFYRVRREGGRGQQQTPLFVKLGALAFQLPSGLLGNLPKSRTKKVNMVETNKGYQNLRHLVPGNKLANEMAWEQIFKWEAMHGGGMECGGIRLISFARFKSNRTPSAAWAVFMGCVFISHQPSSILSHWVHHDAVL